MEGIIKLQENPPRDPRQEIGLTMTFQEINTRLQGLFGAAILEVAPESAVDHS